MNSKLKNSLQDNSLAVLPSPHSGIVEQFFLEHIRNVNLLLNPEPNQLVPDHEFSSNEEFWKVFLNHPIRRMYWVKLNGFQISDWYPRSPGVFHTQNAKWHREQSKQYRREEDGVRFLEPYGKINMIEGGLGSIRFKTHSIAGELSWLCTATSDGFCHSGIPLAISDRLMRQIDFDANHSFSLIGQVQFLSDPLQRQFAHVLKVPQIYVRIEELEHVSTNSQPIYVTPMVFFTSSKRGKGVTYITCQDGDYAELDRAANWLTWYVTKYEGEIITNFDEQRPTFDTARMSLQKLMTGQLETIWMPESIGRDLNIYITNGGSIIQGDVATGADFVGRDKTE